MKSSSVSRATLLMSSLLAFFQLAGCKDRSPLGEIPAVDRQTFAVSVAPPSPDLCGTWEAVDLSVTTPPISNPPGNSSQDRQVKDTHTFCRPIDVQVPLALDALGGASRDTATLTFETAGTGPSKGGTTTVCRYKRTGSNDAGASYPLLACESNVKAGATVHAQTFSLSLESAPNDPPHTVRVVLGNGSPTAPDAYRDYLGTTPNLKGVTLRVPASGLASFSGVGLADGPAFALHDFVSQPPVGVLVVGPCVQVLGPSSLGPGARLLMPYDAAWAASLPAGSLDTLAVQQVRAALGVRAAIDASPLADVNVSQINSTVDAGIGGAGTFLTTIADLTPISYYGGPLMQNGAHVYFIWAGDFDSMGADDPRPVLRQFVNDLPGSPWLNILLSYGITNPSVTLAGEQTRADIKAIKDVFVDAVEPAIAPGRLPLDPDGIYLVVVAGNVAVDIPRYCNPACGWHTDIEGTPTIKYGLIGNPLSCRGCAGSGSVHGPNVDPVVSITAHEIVETMTDPEGTGWHGATAASDGSNVENADKCAWVYHSTQQTADTPPLSYDMVANSDEYYIQSNWVRVDGGYCGMGIESVSIAAAGPAGGLVISEVGDFAVTITNTGPVYLDANEFEIIGSAGETSPDASVPVSITTGIPSGGSVTVTVPVEAPSAIQGNTESILFTFQVRDPLNLHTFPTTGSVAVDVRSAATLTDDSLCLNVSVPPAVDVDKSFIVAAKFENHGTTNWDSTYRLVGLPTSQINTYLQTPMPSLNIFSGGWETFSFSAYAPDGYWGQDFSFDVSMANAAQIFGQLCHVTTHVNCAAGAGGPCGFCGTGNCDGSCNEPPEVWLASSSFSTIVGVPPTEITVFEGPCPNGMQRGTCTAERTDGTGSCSSYWATDDVHDCTCKMHVGADFLESVACKTSATERTCP